MSKLFGDGMSTRNRIADGGAALAAVMFVGSLGLPGLVYLEPTPNGHTSISGGALFASGFLGLVRGNFAWIANPLALIAFFWILRDLHAGLSAKLAFAAFLISFHAWTYTSTPLDTGGAEALVSVGLGFWVWQASTLVLAITRLPIILKDRRGDALWR